MKQADALIALLAGGGAFLLLKKKPGSDLPPVIPPNQGGPAAPGQQQGGSGVVGTIASIAPTAATVATKVAVGGEAAAVTAEEAAIGTIGGFSVGFVVWVAIVVIAVIVMTIAGSAIVGAKWIRQRLRELNSRAIPNMYECEFNLLRKVLSDGGYTYEISDVADDRFTWVDRSVDIANAVKFPGYRKILRNIKYQGQPANQTSVKYLMILARLLSYEYAYWLAVYGMNMNNSWADPTHPQPNFAGGVYYDEIWGVPLANGQPNDAIYESATAAFEAVRKPGLIPFTMLKRGMQAQAIMYAAKVAGGDGGQRGGFLRDAMGLRDEPGIRFDNDSTIFFDAAIWGDGKAFSYNFVNNTLYK